MMFYPLISGSISFHFLEFNDSSWSNFFFWMSLLVIQAIQGSIYGFMFGIISSNEEEGINWLQYTDMVFLFGSGIYVNLKTANAFIKFLGYVSPFRYTIEPMMRSLLKGLPYVDDITDHYDFTFKEQAVPISIYIAVGIFILGWIIIIQKSKQM